MKARNLAGKIPTLWLAAAVPLILVGCIVQSLNPYYTEGSRCDIRGIEGEWTLLEEGKPQSGKPWVFGKEKVLTFDKNGISASLRVVYFSVGKTFFLDSTADEPGEATSRWWTMHVSPVHVVAKVELRDNRLTLTPIDYDWLEKALQDGTVKIPQMRQKDENIVIYTATPAEWKVFLEKYSNDENVFSERNALHFIREVREENPVPGML